MQDSPDSIRQVGFKAPATLVADFVAVAERQDLTLSQLLRRLMAQAIEKDRQAIEKGHASR